MPQISPPCEPSQTRIGGRGRTKRRDILIFCYGYIIAYLVHSLMRNLPQLLLLTPIPAIAQGVQTQVQIQAFGPTSGLAVHAEFEFPSSIYIQAGIGLPFFRSGIMPGNYYNCNYNMSDPYDSIDSPNRSGSSSCSPLFPIGIGYFTALSGRNDLKYDIDINLTPVFYLLDSNIKSHLSANLGFRITDTITGFSYKFAYTPMYRKDTFRNAFMIGFGIPIFRGSNVPDVKTVGRGR